MGQFESTLVITRIIDCLRLSEHVVAKCYSDPEKAFSTILVAWRAVVLNCLPSQEAWKLENSPARYTLLLEFGKIYSTNWPNSQIYRVLRSHYGVEPQDWWEQRDLRSILDIALASALEVSFCCLATDPE